jgi:hypothetical protein
VIKNLRASHLNSSNERNFVHNWFEYNSDESPEAKVHNLCLDLGTEGKLNVAVRGEHDVSVHDDLAAGHVLVVDLWKQKTKFKNSFLV